jgi:hypothetical protein
MFDAGLVFKAVLGIEIIGQVAMAFFGVIGLGWGHLAFGVLAGRDNNVFGVKSSEGILNKPTC